LFLIKKLRKGKRGEDWNCVIGKSKILFLLRNWKTEGFIPTT